MTDAALARALAVLAVLTINHAFCRIFKQSASAQPLTGL
jgi:hypothetical protein